MKTNAQKVTESLNVAVCERRSKDVIATVVLQNMENSSLRPTTVHTVKIPGFVRDEHFAKNTTVEEHIFTESNSPYGVRPWKNDRSMSVGDLVIYHNKTMRCDPDGWTNINTTKQREGLENIAYRISEVEDEMEIYISNENHWTAKLDRVDSIQVKKSLISAIESAQRNISILSAKKDGLAEALAFLVD